MQDRTRWENIKYFARKGMCYFSPCSFIGPAASIGIYYAVQYQTYYIKQMNILAEANSCGWGDAVYCPDQPELSARLTAEASDYGVQHGRADLAFASPYLIVPWMFTGMVVGAIYGAFQPVRQSVPVQSPHSFNEIKNRTTKRNINLLEGITIDDYPPEYTDPVSFEIMTDPQKLDKCNHVLDMTTIDKLTQRGEAACKCPLCREPFTSAPIASYQPDNELKKEIDNYIAKKNNTTNNNQENILPKNVRISSLGHFAKPKQAIEETVSLLPNNAPRMSMNNSDNE